MRPEVSLPRGRLTGQLTATPAAMSTRPVSWPCLERALAYGMTRQWKGFDPYDALLSPVTTLPMLRNSRRFRLTCTQILKRAPLYLRRLLRIGLTTNPKAL